MKTAEAVKQSILDEKQIREKLQEINNDLQRPADEGFISSVATLAILKNYPEIQSNRTIDILLLIVNWELLNPELPMNMSELCLAINYLDYRVVNSVVLIRKDTSDIKLLVGEGFLRRDMEGTNARYVLTEKVLNAFRKQEDLYVMLQGIAKDRKKKIFRRVNITEIFKSLAEKDKKLKRAIDKLKVAEKESEISNSQLTDISQLAAQSAPQIQTLTPESEKTEKTTGAKEEMIAAIKQGLLRIKNNSSGKEALDADEVAYLALLQLQYMKKFAGFNRTIDALLLMINWELLYSKAMGMRILRIALVYLGYKLESSDTLCKTQSSDIQKLVEQKFLIHDKKNKRYWVSRKIWLAFEGQQSLTIAISGRTKDEKITAEAHYAVDITKFFNDNLLTSDPQLQRVFVTHLRKRLKNLHDVEARQAELAKSQITMLEQKIEGLDNLELQQENQQLKAELNAKNKQILQLTTLLRENGIELPVSFSKKSHKRKLPQTGSESESTSRSDSEQAVQGLKSIKFSSSSSPSLAKLVGKQREALHEESSQVEVPMEEAQDFPETTVENKSLIG